MSEITVYSRGRAPNDRMIVGEGPGQAEARMGIPFVGPAGDEQDAYLAAAGGPHSRTFYVTNVVKTYIEGNPDPTPALVSRWTPYLIDEIERVQPKFIIAAGRFASRWFLGEDVDMEMVHGIPHRSDRAPGAVILPVYHPASGLHNDEMRALSAYDYRVAVAAITGRIRNLTPPQDTLAGRESYLDVNGKTVAFLLNGFPPTVISLDTEGVPSDPWSIQFSIEDGKAYVLRCSQRDFEVGIAALRKYCHKPGVIVVMQNAMYDYEMCRVMGLDLFEAVLYDTRYAAYAMRLEPQGLKPLLYRWCGMRQASYEETVGPIGLEKQLAYLNAVLDRSWPAPEPRLESNNDGTQRLYKPQPVERRAEAILIDYYGGKLDKDGNLPDPYARWRKVDSILRRGVEAVLGPMPIGTLADIPLDRAVYYAGRDADGTRRLYFRLLEAGERQGITQLVRRGNNVLPIFEEMQATGMKANRAYCVRKSQEMSAKMERIQSRISHRYYDGRPFNPASSDKVAALMRRQGLTGEKKTKTRKMSTAKKSIEHLRYTNDAMADVISWREHQKLRDSFYDPITERIDDAIATGANPDEFRIRTKINPYKVVSRRISSSDPNLTAIPVRNELSAEVRDGFEAEDGCVLGSWDLSQIEMRYMAHRSKDPLLCRFFHEGRDVHAETAARIFKIELAMVKELDHRYPAKRAGFGIITNIMGQGLLDQLRMFGCKGWTVDSCNDLIEGWLGVYGGVKRFMDESKAEAHRYGYVKDEWGMTRYLPGVYSNDERVRAEAERAASSMKIQGGAQGMLQNAMVWLKPHIRSLQQAGYRIRWVLQIHDEIILEFQEDLWETVDALVIEALTQHHGVEMIVPVKAKGSYAKTWGKLKG